MPKFSEMAALTAVDVTDLDFIPIVDESLVVGSPAFANKRVSIGELAARTSMTLVTALGAVTGAQAHTLASGGVVTLTLTGNVTLTLSGYVAGRRGIVSVVVVGDGVAVLTLAGGTVTYPAGVPPVMANGEIRYMQVVSDDGGVTLTAFVAGGAAVPLAGGVMTGPLSTPMLTLPHGATPPVLADGDVWTTAAGLFVRVSGGTVGPLGTGGGGGGSGVTLSTKTASYVAALADADTIVEMNVASANTFTVPANATVAFPVGTILQVAQLGAGQTTLVAAGGVTFRLAPGALATLKGQYALAMLIQRAANEWYVTGDLT